MKKIAVIGAGISGLSAAWLLKDKYDVTLFEKESRLGGHSNTAEIEIEGQTIPVDTGFIVFNKRTYPHLVKFFEALEVGIAKSDMSFGVKINEGKFEYSGANLAGLFAQKSHLLSPRFYKMLWDIMRFNKRAALLLQQENNQISLSEYLDQLGVSQWFRDYYLLPMGAAIWSCTKEEMKRYPAERFIRFFDNHGLLTVLNQPQWYTVRDGSREYVKKIAKSLPTILHHAVTSVSENKDGVTVKDNTGQTHQFDDVIFASHADETLAMLENPTAEEQAILSAFSYSKNTAILHRDSTVMPQRKAAWASWIYALNEGNKEKHLSVSYWMNQLQPLACQEDVFVTLNPLKEPTTILGRFDYQHPIFNRAAITAQKRLGDIQGKRHIWFAGSYLRYGFHEDGILSAVNVAHALGVETPWSV